MIRESDIVHECGKAWVPRERGCYTVFVAGITHSKSDSSYTRDADGLSIAIARANYLGKRSGGSAPPTPSAEYLEAAARG